MGVLVLAASAMAATSCSCASSATSDQSASGDAPSGDKPKAVLGAEEIDGVPVTRTIPRRVTDSCGRAGARARIAVYCPTLIPDFRIYKANGFGPVTPAMERRFFESTFNNAGPFHWTVGGGTRQTVRRYVLSSVGTEGRRKRPRLVKTTRTASGRLARLYRFPPYEQSGLHGGHMLAVITQGSLRVFASMHGDSYGDLALAVGDSMTILHP